MTFDTKRNLTHYIGRGQFGRFKHGVPLYNSSCHRQHSLGSFNNAAAAYKSSCHRRHST